MNSFKSILLFLFAVALLFPVGTSALRADLSVCADGAFSGPDEYANAERHVNEWDLGYMRVKSDLVFRDDLWHVLISMNHFFNRPGVFKPPNLFDANSFSLKFAAADEDSGYEINVITLLEGECPEGECCDMVWAEKAGLYDPETGFKCEFYDDQAHSIFDDGGCIVSLKHPDGTYEWRQFNPYVDHGPGDPLFDLDDYFGAFAVAGFNPSAYYYQYEQPPEGDAPLAREVYEAFFLIPLVDEETPYGKKPAWMPDDLWQFLRNHDIRDWLFSCDIDGKDDPLDGKDWKKGGGDGDGGGTGGGTTWTNPVPGGSIEWAHDLDWAHMWAGCPPLPVYLPQ